MGAGIVKKVFYPMKLLMDHGFRSRRRQRRETKNPDCRIRQFMSMALPSPHNALYRADANSRFS